MTGICNERLELRVAYAKYTAVNGFEGQNFTYHSLARRVCYGQLYGLAGAT